MKDKSFQFRASWYEAISQLPASSQGVAYSLIMGYALEGLEPNLDDYPAIVQGIFLVVREQIDADTQRQAEISAIRKACGKLGGRPRKSDQSAKATSSTPIKDASDNSNLGGGQKQNNQKVYLVSENTQVAELEQGSSKSIGSSCSTQGEKAKGFASFPLSSPFSLSPITPISNPPIIPQSPCHLRFAQMTQHQHRAREAKFLGGDEGQLSLTDVSPHKDLMGQGACSFVAYFNAQLAKKQSRIPSLRSLQGKRLTELNARLREYGEDALKEAVDNLVSSEMLNGRNARGWHATFDWFIQSSNFTKVLENNYKELFTSSNTTNATTSKSYDPRRGCSPTATSASDYYTSF
ncbi:MAG: DUF6291 domain-containing protein [Porphyromonas sp.]|uniref:DUF6291 domain-containing protein n=1 Tax=Porphyromonas sp. TaxID=1924944 RepID=UPI002A75A52A|nr:DUF6291 domain-containing protein [Porphyromonas sp.]MDY3112611.1 DUF6291 domain-containing protein [Porphyromonas sp.]